MLFELGPDVLRALLAELRLQVVEGGSGRPLPEARVTLFTARHELRRDDLKEARPGGEGRVRFDRLVPGDYHLLILLEDPPALFQERLRLAPGEPRDLGRIELVPGPELEVLVVDRSGVPVPAQVRVGVHQPGQPAEALYSPQAYFTNDGGEARLPRPAGPCLLQARLAMVVGSGLFQGEPRSSHVLVDPATLPPGPLVLTVADPVAVEVLPGPDALAAARLRVVDEAGLVVAAADGAGAVPFLLVPGRYRAEAVDAAGAVLSRRAFELGEEPLEVQLP